MAANPCEDAAEGRISRTGRLSPYSRYEDGIRVLPGSYTLYVDESGVTGGGGYFTVAGLLIHQDGAEEAEEECYNVMWMHGGLEAGRMCELKFTHMMGPRNGFPDADGCRSGPACGILDIIGRGYMPFFCMIVDKKEFRETKTTSYRDMDHYATEHVITAALRHAGGRGIRINVIRDEGIDYWDEYIEESLNSGTSAEGYRIRNRSSYRGYDREKSDEFIGLQLADFCAGATARILRSGKPDCYSRIWQLQDTPRNREAAPAFYPEDGSARSRFMRIGHTCPCITGRHAFPEDGGIPRGA